MSQMIEQEIGPVPSEEDCARVGTEDYQRNALTQCWTYVRQVQRHYPPPEGASVYVKSFLHDFGRYYEVVVHGPREWVCEVEKDPKCALRNWDEEARSALGLGKIDA